jgi:hypothetical protein
MAQAVRITDGHSTEGLLKIESLTRYFPIKAVKQILEETEKTSKRVRDLPAHVMMYYVIAMTIYMDLPYREVLKQLMEGGSRFFSQCRKKPPVKSSICKARIKLGWEPFQKLHDQLVKPIAVKKTKGAWYKDRLLVGIDGSTVDVADTPENSRTFGRSKSARGRSAFPQVRFVSLLEIGTRVLFGTKFAGINKASEKKLAKKVLSSLKKGMLCLADRYYLGYDFLKAALKTEADILWRASNVWTLKPEKYLQDGSYLCTIYKSASDKKNKRNGILVRVIEYSLKGYRTKYRLVTSILDPKLAPAEELAALYHERWEIEISFGELKTRLRGADIVLRSQKPDLVKQEFYGFLLSYFAIRGIMHEAALEADEDPDRLSFIHTVRVVKRALPHFVAFPPSAAA